MKMKYIQIQLNGLPVLLVFFMSYLPLVGREEHVRILEGEVFPEAVDPR